MADKIKISDLLPILSVIRAKIGVKIAVYKVIIDIILPIFYIIKDKIYIKYYYKYIYIKLDFTCFNIISAKTVNDHWL